METGDEKIEDEVRCDSCQAATAAEKGSILWQAYLDVTYDNDQGEMSDCSAVILTEKYVITAASCTFAWTKSEDGTLIAGQPLMEDNLKVSDRTISSEGLVIPDSHREVQGLYPG